MLIRLIALVIVGTSLGGYLPGGLTGQFPWVVWLTATLIVFGGPRMLRWATGRAVTLNRRV